MIDTIEQRRHLVNILLPRIEVLVSTLTGPDVRETVRRLLDGEGDAEALKTLRGLRVTVTLYDNALLVEAAIRESFALVLGLS